MRGREVDALRAFALRMRVAPPEEWPHALLMLGDQVYADEVHPAVQRRIPGEEVQSIALREAPDGTERLRASAREADLARAANVPDPEVGWRLAHDRPWFNNQVAMLELEGRHARFRLEKALADESSGHGVRIEEVFSHSSAVATPDFT
jgi:hypothetical protein